MDSISRPEEFTAGKAPSKRLLVFLEGIVRDLRLSCRNLARNPGFTIVVIVTLALGIGVNTAVFTLVDSLVFQPLPVPNPHQIVSLGSVIRGRENSNNHSYAGASARTGNAERVKIETNSVGPGYFETVRIPVIQGRGFRWTDDQHSRQVSIISEPVAKRLWPNADPIGKRFSTGSDRWEVVGVAGEIRHRRLGGGQNPQVYFSLLQRYRGTFTLMVRSQKSTAATVATMRRAVHELDPGLPTFGPASLADTIAESVAPWLFLTFLLGVFGVLALILASVGLYGILSHSVFRKTREIAVRLAMGARRNHTVWLILKRAMVLVTIGLCIGIGLALGMGQLVGFFLSDFDVADPVTYLVAAFVILAASLLACWVPAYRIARLEPMEALRHE